jgi:transcriptional regulator with XRE-family HTH domain
MKGGTLIREARKRAGLTQRRLAQVLGTSQSVVARWEAGAQEPSLATVARAVRAAGFDLHVSIAEPDDGHRRLIADALALPPAVRLARLVDLLHAQEALHAAVRK